jgi:hypothetical protein
MTGWSAAIHDITFAISLGVILSIWLVYWVRR